MPMLHSKNTETRLEIARRHTHTCMNDESKPQTSIGMWRRAALGPISACLIGGGLVSSLGCGGEELEQRDLGNTGSELEAAGGAGADRTPVVVAGAVDPFIEGQWVGHAEDPFAASGPNGERPSYTFPSGSSQILLDIFVGDGYLPGGQITFGAGPAPAPRPGVAYPPGFAAQVRPEVTGTLEIQLPPVEGFSYPLQEHISRSTSDVGTAAGVLSLGYAPNAAYERWCALQPPRQTGEDTFDCVTVLDPSDPAALCASEFADGSVERFDCNLYNMCLAENVCHCTETECTLARVPANDLWLTRDGDDLLVTFVGAVFDYGSDARYLPVGMARFQRVVE